jgi:hypothetical protein
VTADDPIRRAVNDRRIAKLRAMGADLPADPEPAPAAPTSPTISAGSGTGQPAAGEVVDLLRAVVDRVRTSLRWHG